MSPWKMLERGRAMMQRYDICTEQLSAWLLVLHCTSASDNRFYKTVHAFGSVVQRLAGEGDGEVTVDDLLNAPPFKTISHNDKNVVTGFTKEWLNCHIIYWFSTSSRTVANPPLILSSSWTIIIFYTIALWPIIKFCIKLVFVSVLVQLKSVFQSKHAYIDSYYSIPKTSP